MVRHDPCAWLPSGGRADVVGYAGTAPPSPTAMVRLLVTSRDHVLVVPRPDGGGLDIPARRVTGSVAAALEELRSAVIGPGAPPRLVGFVRNVVPVADPGYPWPTPLAHFAVWRCEAERGSERDGRWLAPDDAARHLGQRHWWPLLATAQHGAVPKR